MAQLIVDPSELSPQRLTQILRAKGYIPRAEVSAFTARQGPITRPSVSTYLELTYAGDAGDAPPALFLKVSNPENPDSEVEFYDRLLQTCASKPPTVECLQACYSEAEERYHLLLRDVSADYLTPTPGAEWIYPTAFQAQALAAAFARLHAAFWESPLLARPADGDLEDYLRQEHTSDRGDLKTLWDYAGDRMPPAMRPILEKIADQTPQLLKQRLESGHRLTLCHRDANIWNVLYPKRSTHPALIIDWISYRMWFGCDDLASHIARFWHPWTRRHFEMPALRHYHEKLIELGVENYVWADCLYDYRLGVISALNDEFYAPAPNKSQTFDRILENVLSCFVDLESETLLR